MEGTRLQQAVKRKFDGKTGFISRMIVGFFCENTVFFQFLRSCVVGAVAFVFDYAVLQIFMLILPAEWYASVFNASLDISLIIATALGFVVGLTVNYILSVFFVFTKEGDKERGTTISAFMKFAVMGIIGLILTMIGMQIGAALVGTEMLQLFVTKVIVTLIVFVWNYFSRKIFIFS